LADVIDLPMPQRAPAATPSYRRIRAASRAFEVLFTVLFAAFVVLAAASVWVVLFYQGNHIVLGPDGGFISTEPITNVPPFSSWALDQKLAYALVAIVRAAPAIVLFWLLRSLFRLYGRGQVFGRRNAALIMGMGACLAADALAPFACHVALSATGYEIDRVWMHMASVQELVLGAVVVVIALVMQAGREIEEDREGFV
jgi:DUF2975 family protein